VGDAGYFKDPISAHGISDALRDAELLARAVVRGDDAAFRLYEAVRDEMSLPLFEATEAIASLEWDNARLKGLHQSLSDAMKQEVAALLVLHDGDEAARRSA
jgi:flavin-dependent dehydrogenase